jgi:UDP-N-acetylglucosamine--N-acetylmuramyl-(pentapeptide) pyrophosphoryl-undecaprenol N-acetylglucosamine transferase
MAAGGTGGHVMPAVAVAKGVLALDPEAEFLFVGAGRPAEEAALAPGGWSRAAVKAAPVKGKGLPAKVKGVARAFQAFFQALAILRRFRPDLVFGSGGYSSGPVGLAAWVMRVPLVIHEQNRRPGLANRALGRLAARIFLGDPGAAGSFPAGRTVCSGNPVRPEIFVDAPKGGPRGEGAPFTLLVLGGSQGAESLNRAVAEALPGLKSLEGGDGRGPLPGSGARRVRVIHQAGAAGEARLRPLYEASGLEEWELGAFFTDMARLYREADLALCRSGALTLAELASAAVPAALVPFPWAADDHQTENARAFEAAGAAILLPERVLSGEAVVSLVRGFLAGPDRLGAMSRAAMALARRDAAAVMAEEVLRLARGRRERRGRKAAAGEKIAGAL